MTEDITELAPNQIFVFGSNTEGRHGAGAALAAMKWGAVYWQSTGIMGQTYAICTKDLAKGMRSVPLEDIKEQLAVFAEYAKEYPELEFLLTPVGCGLGGYAVEELEALLPAFTDNVILTWKGDMSHFVEKCKICDDIVSQCRCPSK